MSKNKELTIADLKVNWTFDFSNSDRDYDDTRFEFRKLNDGIHDLRISERKYTFFVSYSNISFEINSGFGFQLTDLLLELDCRIYCLQLEEKISKLLILDYFELIRKNIFRIHVKE
jgi:hypothetical protein